MARKSTCALLLAPLDSDRNLPHFFSGATLPMSSMGDLFRRLPKRQTTKLVPEVSAKSGQLPESSESSFRNWRDTKMSPEGRNFSKLFRQKWIFNDCLEGPLMAWTSFYSTQADAKVFPVVRIILTPDDDDVIVLSSSQTVATFFWSKVIMGLLAW